MRALPWAYSKVAPLRGMARVLPWERTKDQQWAWARALKRAFAKGKEWGPS